MGFNKIKLPVSLLILLLFGLILVALQLMSSATQGELEFDNLYSYLVLINSLGSLVLLILVGVNVYSLIQQLRQKQAGSRLTTRMVSLFVLLALSPAAIVFYFSVQFLHQGIDSWFNVEIDKAMEDALELSQASLDQRMNWHSKQTQIASEKLLDISSETLMALEISTLRENLDALEMTLLSKQGRIIAFSSNSSDIVPQLLNQSAWLRLRQTQNYIALESTASGVLVIQVIVPIQGEQMRYLQTLYPVPVRMADLADSIEFAFVRYQEMSFLRDSLKSSFALALILVLLLSLLAAIWVAFISIRHIVAPVKALVKGTQAVAAGDYEQQLPVMMEDDLGFLVQSFNQMTQRIAQSRDQAKAASFEVEQQRAYLESILANVSAGVLSFDANLQVRTANQAAYQILHCKPDSFGTHSLAKLADENTSLAEFFLAVQQQIETAQEIWQERIAFLGVSGRQELLCRGTPLFLHSHQQIGAVVVFDDLTDLIQAQKNAAWGEVARRLAHEIKNPLTPIQLAAERLQHKLASQLEAADADILQRSTRTIVQQVEAMKRMVDDFSEYAKPSKPHQEQLNLHDLIQEILVLYNLHGRIKFNMLIEINLANIMANPVSMRQVLHNLLKNAQEAMDNTGLIEINLQLAQHNHTKYLELSIYDEGIGIDIAQVDTLFEPYVTTKLKGTGLGLAIVKKIIIEHGGLIWVDKTYTRGAGFIMQLPCA